MTPDAASIHRDSDPLEDVIQRVWRRFHNEVPKHEHDRVGSWLAGVSFDEWFALVDAYREAQGV